jgi:hypothetical protein
VNINIFNPVWSGRHPKRARPAVTRPAAPLGNEQKGKKKKRAKKAETKTSVHYFYHCPQSLLENGLICTVGVPEDKKRTRVKSKRNREEKKEKEKKRLAKLSAIQQPKTSRLALKHSYLGLFYPLQLPNRFLKNRDRQTDQQKE